MKRKAFGKVLLEFNQEAETRFIALARMPAKVSGAFVYSLETFVPLLKLQVSQYWLPNANRGKEVPGPFLRELMLKTVVQFLFGKRMEEYWLRKLNCTFKIPSSTTGAWLRTYLWWHIIAGWIFTTLWVVGLTGLVKT